MFDAKWQKINILVVLYILKNMRHRDIKSAKIIKCVLKVVKPRPRDFAIISPHNSIRFLNRISLCCIFCISEKIYFNTCLMSHR